ARVRAPGPAQAQEAHRVRARGGRGHVAARGRRGGGRHAGRREAAGAARPQRDRTDGSAPPAPGGSMNEREDDGMELERLRGERTWQALRTAAPRLDDVTRARMLAGIRQRLAEAAEEPLTVPTRSRAPWLLGAAALVAVAAV